MLHLVDDRIGHCLREPAMTLRSLAALTLASTLLLLATLALNQRQPSDALGSIPGAGEADSAMVELLTTTVPEPPAARQAQELDATAAPVATVTPIPGPMLTAVVAVEPPALVEIPADLIATPTPDSPTPVPLPFLTNIPTVPRDGSVVYLTFDDGPDPVYTNQILDVLARYGAKATFFVLGNSVDAYPGVVQRMVAEGHAVGNHTYFHEALPNETHEAVVQTLDATSGALARAIGRTSSCMRPPYGAMDQATYELVVGRGFTVHMWEVDSEDWRINDSYSIASSVLATTNLGDRVLFHDGPANRAATVAAVESVLSVLSTRGVQFHALSC